MSAVTGKGETGVLGEACEVNPRKPPLNGIVDDTMIMFVPMAAVDEVTGTVAHPEIRPLGDVKKKSYRTFAPGDVLFAKITPCMENGKSAVVPEIPSGLGFGSTEFHVLRPRQDVDARFIWYFIRQERFRRTAEEHMSGSVGQLRVPAAFLESFPIAIPDTETQAKIVRLLDKADAASRSARTRIDSARRAIERFRQAVLAAACSGRLTADWRAENDDVDGIAPILDACDDERQARRARNTSVSELPDGFEAPVLPPEWSWQPLGAVTVRIGDVDHKMPKARLEGVPYISTKDFTLSGIGFHAAKLISADDFARLAKKIQPENNDILVSRYGTVGEIRRVETDRQFLASYSVAIVKTCKKVDIAPWLALALASPIPQAFMRAHIRASAQPDLGLQHIRQVPIPMPPLAEQREITRRVDQLMMLADGLRQRIEAAAKQLERSSEAVLAKAFRGDLVTNGSGPAMDG